MWVSTGVTLGVYHAKGGGTGVQQGGGEGGVPHACFEGVTAGAHGRVYAAVWGGSRGLCLGWWGYSRGLQ